MKKKKNIIMISILILILAIGGLFVFLFMRKDGKGFSFQLPQVSIPTPPPKPKLKIVNKDSINRPFAVMIDNNVGNDNHAGLLDAYLTYEIIVEGGLSRIMAVYKDTNTKLIGPVRSSRHYFLDYALENNAIYAHFGWSTFAENDIKKLKINNINGMTNGGSAYWRDKKIASPHNVFTSMEKLKGQAESLGYKRTGSKDLLFQYQVEPIDFSTREDKQVVQGITVRYISSQTRSYTYDSTTKMYLRSMNGKPHVDKETKEQLSYKNVIIQQVTNKTLDNVGHQDLVNLTSGDGYYLTEGILVPIKWTKTSREGKTKYTYLTGEEITLNDGRTMIQMVPSNQKVTIDKVE